ncbi:MAG: ankyrin repeat domain-containing protein [Pseudomonadota bacterium]
MSDKTSQTQNARLNLEALRRRAKALRRAYRAGDAEAAARIKAALGEPAPAADALKHAQALLTIAREAGFASWPRLKLAAEMAAMDRMARAARLEQALFQGQHWVVDALLAKDPDLAAASLGLRIALYDRAAVEAALAADPATATRAVGPSGDAARIAERRPILHLAFSKHIHAAPQKRGAMLAIAEALLAAGADVNDGFPAEPGSEHQLSALYGALGHADNMALATWLLENGADPNDNESLYHATELPHREGVKLLIRHQVRIEGTNALPRALDFDDVDTARLLLEAGADPNEGAAPHPSGQPSYVIPALHQAARRRCSAEMARLLLAHGADGRTSYREHSAYAYARIYGNQPIAAALEAAGQATPLSPLEEALAAAAEGRPAAAVAPEAFTQETRRIMGRILGFGGDLAHAQRLHALGVDPEWEDEMGLPAIHIAGWEGLPDIVRWLLTLGPDLTRKNAYGGDLMGTIIHGAEFSPARETRDHLGCAEAALAAGAPLHARDVEGCGAEELAAFLSDWAERHPERVIAPQ